MVKKCRHCGEPIPKGRHGSSWYCCKEHAYAAKKLRSKKQYHDLKEPYDVVKKNEAILASLFVAVQYRAVITLDDLNSAGLDLGFSTEQIADSNGGIWTMVGDHGYYIYPETKNVRLWKRE